MLVKGATGRAVAYHFSDNLYNQIITSDAIKKPTESVSARSTIDGLFTVYHRTIYPKYMNLYNMINCFEL